ncbi:MAG: ribosomal RNA small subunit methyltransferase A [Clostridia bacterium]|nr:ribosomal RNA small subunit methyltransferase A [Clostridia bacterium]
MNMNAVERARSALNHTGFRANHALGQNFLLNAAYLEKIADLAGVKAGEGVLEIGAGCGILTYEMAARGARVLALEVDRALGPMLEEVLADTGARVVMADALKCDWKALTAEAFGGEPFCVAANLPYGITTDVLRRIIRGDLPIRRVTLLLQREAAQRAAARVGETGYCALSAQVRAWGAARVLMDVPSSAFTPPPHVESAVLEIVPWTAETRPVRPKSEEAFQRTIEAAFAMRRKTLLNNLTRAFGISREQAQAVLSSCGIAAGARGEALGLEELCAIADELSEGRLCQPASPGNGRDGQ